MRQMKMLKRNIFALALAVIVAVSGLTVTPVATNAAVTAPASINFVENDDATCTISWSAVSGATEYNVYEAVSRYATYEKVGTVTETSYTDEDYSGGYYKVTAVAGGAESPKSAATSYEIEVFGYNTNIFEDTDNAKEVQDYVDGVFKNMERGQFSQERNALLFKPGTYNDLLVKIGFYTQVAGLGYSPEDVAMKNIQCPAEWMISKKYDGTINFNALCNFWRSVENLTTNDENTMWAVSQATSMRRMNIKGSLELHEQGGYASGGFLADSKVAGRTYQKKNNKTGKTETAEIGISGGSQQQWLSRNVETNAWDGNVWNYVFVGSEFDSLLDDTNTIKPGPDGEWPQAQYTKIEKTPTVQEKPFLVYDEDLDEYAVFVPALRKDSTGVSWDDEELAGETLPLDSFYIAKPTDSAAKINAELAEGKNLILTPGIYHVDEAIKVENEDTVILGLGYATFEPTKGNAAMEVADVAGVIIAGVLFDAGGVKSPTLLTIGTKDNDADYSENPVALCDTFYRVGGANATPGQATTCVEINSNDVIGDNFWIWRADHGAGVGWYKNLGDYGLIVNGDNVTTYGLMVEHFQKYQTQWNGNGGRCYMYQSELPYDIAAQNEWNAPGSYGYTDYKVGKDVTTHEGYGIGIYSCYQKATCFLESAIECPDVPGVKFTNVCTYSLSGNGGIDFAINKAGYGVYAGGDMCKVMSYNNGKFAQDKTADRSKINIISTQIEVAGKDKFENTFKVGYTGAPITPKVTVSYKGIALRPGVDYTVTYSNNTNIGNGKIVIKGLLNFKESVTYTMKIVPKRVVLTKKKATKKKIYLRWGKVKGASKYQVVYSQKKNFKKKKTVNVKKAKYTIKRKKAGAYYVKVRAFKKVNGKFFYGRYSKAVKFKKVKKSKKK